MVVIESAKGRCGDCKFFDKSTIEKIPFGTRQLPNGETVQLGVCRASMGLVFGKLNELTPCKQPAGTFSPILETSVAGQKT